jgi:hypothetical protein
VRWHVYTVTVLCISADTDHITKMADLCLLVGIVVAVLLLTCCCCIRRCHQKRREREYRQHVANAALKMAHEALGGSAKEKKRIIKAFKKSEPTFV